MSRVWALVAAEFTTFLRRHAALGIMIAALSTLVLTGQAVVGAGISHYASVAQRHSLLNLIEVSGNSAHARQEVDSITLAQMRQVPKVAGVYPWYQHDLELADETRWPDQNVNPGALWATPVVPGLAPALVAGAWPARGLADTEVVLPDRVPGGSTRNLLGHTLQFAFTKIVSAKAGTPAFRSLKVVGIADNSTPGADGPTPSYVSYGLLATINGGTPPQTFSNAYVQAVTAQDVPEIQRTLSAQGFAVSSLASQERDLGPLFDILRQAARAFLILLGVICLATGAATGAVWLRQRYADIGLLKAIGWSRTQIAVVMVLELAGAGVVAALLGIGGGCLVSLTATTAAAHANMALLPVAAWSLPPVSSIAVSLVLVPVCMVLGAAPRAWRAANLDPDRVLRDTA